MNIIQEPVIFTNSYNQGKKIFVLIYMNGCPYCDPILPIWQQLDNDIQQKPQYKLLNSQIKIAKIEKDNLKDLKHYIQQIDSFPTFLHMGKGLTTTKHNPDRNYKSLLDWIKKLSSKFRPRSRAARSHKKYSKGGRKLKKRTKKTKKNRL